MRQPRSSIILVLPALLAMASWAWGQAQGPDSNEAFTVRDVAVDATAQTAAQARDNALAEAQRQAFDRLLARLAVSGGSGRLAKLSNADISNLVAGFEVQDEKNSDVRYIAKLTFHFKQGPVEDLLRQSNIGFAAAASRPLLVLPMLRQGGKDLLWDEPNPWRAAWANLPPAAGLVPIVAPIGDLKDMADITAEQVVKEDAARLQQIAGRYGAGGTLVVTAVPREDHGKMSLEVVALRYDAGLKRPYPAIEVAAQSNESADQLYARAAQAVEAAISERWKQENVLHFDHPEQMTVAVPLGGLDDWLKVRARLGRVAVVSKASLVSLSRKAAVVELQYFGDPAQLKQALGLNELVLSDDGGQGVLRLGGQANVAPGQ